MAEDNKLPTYYFKVLADFNCISIVLVRTLHCNSVIHIDGPQSN